MQRNEVLTESILEESSDTCQRIDLDVCRGLRQTEQHDTGSSSEEGHGELSASSAPFDQSRGGNRTRNTTCRLVSVRSVRVVDGIAAGACELVSQVDTQEGVVKRVSETDGGITEDDERSGPRESFGREERFEIFS